MQNGEHTERLSGGAALVSALLRHGVDTVFGLPGVQIYSIFDSLSREHAIHTVPVHHEQTAALAAFGYAQASGKPGVAVVVPGPGLLNAATGLLTAKGTCVPVLLITGAVPSEFQGKGRGHLHELENQLESMKDVVKWTARIERAQDAFEIVDRAFEIMISKRPGPVVLEIAWDVANRVETVVVPKPLKLQTSDGRSVDGLNGIPLLATRGAPPDQITKLADLLRSSRRPLIFVGAGAQDASEPIRRLSALLTAPVAAMRTGRGIVPEWSPVLDDTPWSFNPSEGPVGVSSYVGSKLFPKCDLLLGIGSRLDQPFQWWGGRMNDYIHRSDDPRFTQNSGKRIKVARIDVDPAEASRLIVDLHVIGDSVVVVGQLLGALEADPPEAKKEYRTEIIETIRECHAETSTKVQPEYPILATIRRHLSPNGVLVEELCQVGFTSLFLFPVLQPHCLISSGYSGTVGSGFPAALGAKLARPSDPVISITGDGGLLFGIGEMATVAHQRIGIVCIVFNNSGFCNVSRDQGNIFGKRAGSVWKDIDYSAIALGLGMDRRAVHRIDMSKMWRGRHRLGRT